MAFIAAFGLSFLVGAIPTAYLFVRYLKQTDIRGLGSGNVGATNAARVLGKKIGVLVFAIDFLKGWLPAFVITHYYRSAGMPTEAVLWAATGAILGHVFCPFLKFRGGKGIATGAGVLAGTHPLFLGVAFGVWVIVFASVRIVSASSLAAIFSIVLATFWFPTTGSARGYFVALLALTFWTHRTNLQRLRKGEEKRLS